MSGKILTYYRTTTSVRSRLLAFTIGTAFAVVAAVFWKVPAARNARLWLNERHALAFRPVNGLAAYEEGEEQLVDPAPPSAYSVRRDNLVAWSAATNPELLSVLEWAGISETRSSECFVFVGRMGKGDSERLVTVSFYNRGPDGRSFLSGYFARYHRR